MPEKETIQMFLPQQMKNISDTSFLRENNFCGV